MAKARHQHGVPLLGLLVRLGWQRDPQLWTVRCRDGHGHRARLLVHLTAAGVCLTVPEPGPLQLNVMQTGRLCSALGDAVFCFGRLAGPARVSASSPGAVSRARRRAVRQRFEFPLPERPSVEQLAARLAGPSTTDSGGTP